MHKPNRWSDSRIQRTRIQRNRWTLWESWIAATAIGELIGLGLVVAASVLLTTVKTANAPMMLLLTGALEGTVLGVCQWAVLRRYVHHSAGWILATTGGAIVAWLVGLTISVLMAIVYGTSRDRVATQALIAGVMLLGVGLGGVMGFAQWLVLRRHLQRSAWWIIANAVAWSLGLLVAFIGAGLPKPHWSQLQVALTGAATGASMGAIIGAITGIALVWLLRRGITRP